jgi:phosphoglycolate phosphatase-like HAD superfamily hydrolase
MRPFFFNFTADFMLKAKFQGIIFDMDGTLTVPALDFCQIREELNIPSGDIALTLNSWSEPQRSSGWAIIERHEALASSNIRLQPNVCETLFNFVEYGIKFAIVTRNTMCSVDKFLSALPVSFYPILTREFPFLKPSPEPVWHILEHWDLAAENCLMVGDFIDDVDSANAAGVYSCYFKNPGGGDFSHAADFTVSSFLELRQLVFCENE